jgi:hypothetical protein
MARRFPSFLLCFALAAAVPLAADALPIALSVVERNAEASASASDGTDVAFDDVHLSDAAPGILDWQSESVVVAVPSRDATAQASPLYRGEVGESAISAQGNAHAGAHTSALGAFAFSSVEVVQRIVFEATADALLRASGYLVALPVVGGTGDALALLEISSLGGVTDPNPLLIRRLADGNQVDFDLEFAVRAGMSYQILSLARASADAEFFGTGNLVAGFVLDVTEVPEPGTAMLLLLGAIALGARRARR